MSTYKKTYEITPSEAPTVWIAATLGNPQDPIHARLAQAAFMFGEARARLLREPYTVESNGSHITIHLHYDGSIRVESQSEV